jgi:hypothetical protein
LACDVRVLATANAIGNRRGNAFKLEFGAAWAGGGESILVDRLYAGLGCSSKGYDEWMTHSRL